MKVTVEIDLDEVVCDVDPEDLLEAFEDDEAILKELVKRLDVSDIINELDTDEIAGNLDYDSLSVLCLRDVAERIADTLSANDAIGFCRDLLKQACDNDAEAERTLADLAKEVTNTD